MRIQLFYYAHDQMAADKHQLFKHLKNNCDISIGSKIQQAAIIQVHINNSCCHDL
jgi:hypothetical protein